MTVYKLDPPPKPSSGPTECCSDPTNTDGGAHPWVLVSEDGPGDVYVCSAGCGAQDVD